MMLQLTGTITCLSPLSHNSDEAVGTDTKFRRTKLQTPSGPQLIPVYSGNAFRGKLRRIAALDFLERIGITLDGDNKISDRLYFTMFSGGSLQKGSSSGGKLDIGFKRELREHIPFLSLFGTAVSNQMIQGKLSVGIAVPVAVEICPNESDRSVWDLVEEIFYTRRDDLENPETPNNDDPQQMKYSGECLSAGTTLKHEFLLNNANDVETSCFGAIMQRFLENPVLGGRSGIGHGKVKLDYKPKWPDGSIYDKHIKTHSEKIYSYMRDVERILK
jgi:hypothetical protein